MSAMCEKEIRIGILAIQGNFSEHRDHLHRLNRNVKAFLVRTLDDFNAANPHGILLPGGESSTHRVAFRDSAPLFERLKSWACTEKRPIWGTCCGLILLSKKVNDTHESHSLDAIDISTIRNAYGSQSESFSAEVSFPEFPNRKVKGLFIRAPVISNIWGNTKILGTINRKMFEGAYLTENGDHPVALSSENVLVTTFHPEFTPDLTMHHYFIDIVERTWGMETEFETGFREDSRHSDLSAFEEAAPNEYGDLAGLLSNKICMVAFVAFCFSEGYEKWFAMWLDVKCISDYVAYDNSNKDIVKKCLEYVKAVYFDKDGNMDFGKRGYTPKNIVYSMQPHFTGETSRLVIFIENMLRVNLRVSLYPSFWRSEYSRKLFAELKRYPIMFKSFDVLSPFHKEFPTAMSGMVRILENLDINEDIYRQIIVSYLESTIKNKCFSEYAVAFYPFDKDSACETESISSNESTGIADLRPISIKGFKRSARSDEQCESLQNENIRRRQKLIKKIARSMSVFRSISKKISH